MTPEQKEEKRKAIDEERNEIEKDLLGGYELIYPLPDTPENQGLRELYEEFLVKSQCIYDKFNIGRRKGVRPGQQDQQNNNAVNARKPRVGGSTVNQPEVGLRHPRPGGQQVPSPEKISKYK